MKIKNNYYLKLVRVDFDNLAFEEPHRESVVSIFISEVNKTAKSKAEYWFPKQPPIKMYLGYDGNIYPQFRLIKETISIKTLAEARKYIKRLQEFLCTAY